MDDEPLNFGEISDEKLIEGYERSVNDLIRRGDLNVGSWHNDHFQLLLKRYKQKIAHPEKITEVNTQPQSSLPENERIEFERINKEWCEAFIEGFNSQDAAVFFALGATKKGKVIACATTDMPMSEIILHLQAYVDTLKKGLKKK